MIKWVAAAALLLGFYASADESAVAGRVPLKPDPSFTNGDYCDQNDEDFDQVRYAEKVAICRRAVTWYTKDEVYKNYKISERCRHYYTVDHFIPLSMGGSNQMENLWPEHKDVKATRQNLEQELYLELNRGQITVEQAVATIVQAKQNPPPVVPKGCN